MLYIVWFQALFDPQWLLAGQFGLMPALKVPLFLVATLGLATLMKPQKGDWMWPIMAWMITAAISLPGSYNIGDSLVPFKQLVVYYVLGLCFVRTVRSPRAAGPIIFMLCVGQYLWWAAFGLRTGMVSWHPDFANFDGYGPLMSVGVGPAYYYAMGAPTPRLKKLAMLVSGLCVLGVISSFARGAILSLVATLGYIWFRSPRKIRTFRFLVIAGACGAIAGSLINGTTRGDDTKANFWDEMSTMFDQSVGSTGDDREVLWAAARKIFVKHPVFGVGAGNFGIAAANEFKMGDVGGAYAHNPKTLYRRALHNIFYEILSEFGIAGMVIFALVLLRFWRNSQVLLRPESAAAWRAAKGTEDIRQITLGLESGMVAFLATGWFYNQLFQVTFYSLVFTNIALHAIVTGRTTPTARAAPLRRRMPVRPLIPLRG